MGKKKKSWKSCLFVLYLSSYTFQIVIKKYYQVIHSLQISKSVIMRKKKNNGMLLSSSKFSYLTCRKYKEISSFSFLFFFIFLPFVLNYQIISSLFWVSHYALLIFYILLLFKLLSTCQEVIKEVYVFDLSLSYHQLLW